MDNKTAKEIFQKYKGMLFFMIREENGDYEKYSSFHISKEQEREWLREMQSELREKLNHEQNPKLQINYLRDYADVSRGLEDQHSFQFLLSYIEQYASVWDTDTLILATEVFFSHIQVTYNSQKLSHDNEVAINGFISSIIRMLNEAKGYAITLADKELISNTVNNLRCYMHLNRFH